MGFNSALKGLSMPYTKSVTFFTYNLFCSQLFESTAFCLTVCCSLYVRLVTFNNNI